MKISRKATQSHIKLNRKSDLPLYSQLCDAIIASIKQGKLKPGQRLPAVVELAAELSVTQSTVMRAFDLLQTAGYIESHVGRGTFVKAPASPTATTAKGSVMPAYQRSPVEPVDPEFALAARRLRMGIAKSLDALAVLAKGPGLIDFTSGVPDPSLARPDILAEMARLALVRGQAEYQGYGAPQGMPELRAEIAKRLDPQGTRLGADNVLVTSGSQQAISLLAQAALEQSQRVVCEVPCYLGVANAFGALGHWVESVPRDEHGPLPDRFSRIHGSRPVLFYLCPELHNPMGTDLSDERRAQLVDWAESENVTLIADEIFHDLRFEGAAPPSLLQAAGVGRTIVIGSLSKSFMCGLRVGWLVTSVERVRALLGLKRAMDISCAPLMQGLAHALLTSGAYDEHLVRARAHYRERRDATLAALGRTMPKGVRFAAPVGGFHTWLELPPGYSSIALYLLAVQRGVVIVPGPKMDIDHRFISALRLSYGSVAPDKIQEGIELLADATRELMQSEPSDPGLSGLGSFL